MPHAIKQFQALTTRQRDVVPEKIAKNLDHIIAGLEAQYDRSEMLALLAAFEQHIVTEGYAAHANLAPDLPGRVVAFYNFLYTEHTKIADPALTRSAFDAIFAERPELVSELVRRLCLNARSFQEGAGSVDDPYYTAEGIGNVTPDFERTIRTITPAMEGSLLVPATEGNSYYQPLSADSFPLPRSGHILLTLAHFNDTPDEERPLLTLSGADFSIVVRQLTAGVAVFEVGVTLGEDPEVTETMTLEDLGIARTLLLTYTHNTVQVYKLTENGAALGTVVAISDHALVPTQLQIHVALEPLSASSSNLIPRSTLEGGAIGDVPTWWHNSTGDVTFGPTVSLLGGDDVAYEFEADNSRPWIAQHFTWVEGATYTYSVLVEELEYVSGDDIIAGVYAMPEQDRRFITVADVPARLPARVSVTFTPTEAIGVSYAIRLGMGVAGNATGRVVISRPQLELGSIATPYMPTGSDAVRRLTNLTRVSVGGALAQPADVLHRLANPY